MGWRASTSALIKFYLASSAASVTATALSPVNGTVGDVVWGSCGNDTLPGAECGYAIVPLDYFDSSVGVAKIALGRYNATSGTRKGSVFINPGGPGGSGVPLATVHGTEIQTLIGEDWDVIGFDPRGIGATEPATKCFVAPGARSAYITNTVLDRSYDVSPNVTDALNRNHLVELQRDANALYKTQFAICKQTMGELLKYMGTSTVVRDIDFMTTLLDGENALINFYGLSYGTIIGQYLVNMFPERVGRVTIDGVVDAELWTSVPPFKRLRTFLNSTETAYSIFFSDCASAGPSSCALASKEHENPKDIMKRVEDFVNGLYSSPLPVPNATAPGILTSGRARMFILGNIETPSTWPDLAQALSAAMSGDGSVMLDTVNTKGLVDLERSAVTCNDVAPFSPPSAEEVIDEALFNLVNRSRFSLAGTTLEPDDGCEYWPVAPPERFAGPFSSTLNNPILIISNTADPSTPLLNGQVVHARMGSNSSALLVQNGPGHTSIALTSTCTVLNLRAYYANGTLPKDGTVCEVDQSPFAVADTSSSEPSTNSTSSASPSSTISSSTTSSAVSMVSSSSPAVKSSNVTGKETSSFVAAHQKLRASLPKGKSFFAGGRSA